MIKYSNTIESLQIVAPKQQKLKDESPNAEQTDMILTLEKETSLNPENEEAWTQLGNLYFDINNTEKAINAYSKSLRLNPNDSKCLIAALNQAFRPSIIGIDSGSKSTP
jgi:cytochrome c-type biogenesis protein CcmH/NrfG